MKALAVETGFFFFFFFFFGGGGGYGITEAGGLGLKKS